MSFVLEGLMVGMFCATCFLFFPMHHSTLDLIRAALTEAQLASHDDAESTHDRAAA